MKVNLTRSQHKKSLFPISFDSSTTQNFGEVLPFFMYEAPADTHLQIKNGSGVRFAPLSLPTFGRSQLKNYFFRHRISDLYPPFNDLLAQTPYTPSNGDSYIPSKVPSVPLWFLWLSVISNCEFSLYLTDWSYFRSVNQPYNGYSPAVDGDHNFLLGDLTFELIKKVYLNNTDLSSSSELSSLDISNSLPLWIIWSLYHGNFRLPYVKPFSSAEPYQSYYNDYTNGPDTTDFKFLPTNIFSDTSIFNLGSVYLSNSVAGQPDSAVSIESADYIFHLGDSLDQAVRFNDSSNQSFVSTGQGKDTGDIYLSFETDPSEDGSTRFDSSRIMVAIRLNDSGKMLRKILMGLGYQIAPIEKEVSLLPLYAYFKSYFDSFAPKRFVKFEQSYFARLINYLVTTGSDFVDSQINTTSFSNFSWDKVLDDLLSCYYTKNTDYYSAQIIGMINDYGGDLSASYVGVDNSPAAKPLVSIISSDNDHNGAPSIDFNKNLNPNTGPAINLNHTQAQQNILSRLTQFVNRRSVIGGKLAALLKSVFGISSEAIDEYNSYITSHSVDVDINDVFSTAETSDGYLGEYAGKAVSSGHGEVSIDTDAPSIILGLSVLVPRTQYVQGVNPLVTHVGYSDFYNPMYDGLTLLPTSRCSLYCGSGLLPYVDSEKSFGNLPIYSEYKTKTCGILSGDLSLRSTRASYDSFTMDEIISESESVTYDSDGDIYKGTLHHIELDYDSLVCGTMWRYLGRWLWLGKFDRIFINNRLSFNQFWSSFLPQSSEVVSPSTRNLVRTDDNVIVHHVIDMRINSPMVPLAGSFMTDDLLALSDSLESQVE